MISPKRSKEPSAAPCCRSAHYLKAMTPMLRRRYCRPRDPIELFRTARVWATSLDLSHTGATVKQACKDSLARKFLLLILLALSFSDHARAQVMVDVSKITCDQFATYKITNPEYIAIWLGGYYHGTRGDMK